MQNRGITSTYIRRAAFALLTSLGLLAAIYALAFFAAPVQAQQIDINEDNSINDSFNTDLTIRDQEQNCNVIVGQYNDVVAGDAVAGGDAAAATAASVDAPVNVVNNCIQAGGDVVIGSNDGNDGDGDDGTVDPGDEETTGGEETTGSDTTTPEDANCPAAQQVAQIGPNQTENDIQTFTTTGTKFRVDYSVDFEDDASDEFENDFVVDVNDEDGFFVEGSDILIDEDEVGSFIVTESAGDYEVETNVSPEGGVAYTVTVFDCTGDSSGGGGTNPGDNPGGDDNTGTNNDRESSVMDGTYDQNKTLAKTGGSTIGLIGGSYVSFALISSGALLVLCGAGIAVWIGRSVFAGRG